MDPKRAIVRQFDDVAGDYDTVVPFFRAFGEKLVEWAGLEAMERQGGIVLDRGATFVRAVNPGPRGEPSA